MKNLIQTVIAICVLMAISRGISIAHEVIYDIIYDNFDDAVIDAGLWGGSGPVYENNDQLGDVHKYINNSSLMTSFYFYCLQINRGQLSPINS